MSPLFGRAIGRGRSPESLRRPHITPIREPNPVRELIRTDAMHDWLRELRTHELLEVFHAVVDELAWKIAQRARLDSPNGKVRAAITIRGVLFQGWGLTSTEAMQHLAQNIDQWGRRR